WDHRHQTASNSRSYISLRSTYSNNRHDRSAKSSIPHLCLTYLPTASKPLRTYTRSLTNVSSMSNVTTLTNPVIWSFKLALFHIHGIVITQHCTSIIPLIEMFWPVHFSPKSRFDQPAWKISPSMIGKRI